MAVGGLEEEYDYNYHAVEGLGDFFIWKISLKIFDFILDFLFHFWHWRLGREQWQNVLKVSSLKGSCEFDGTKAKATVQDTFNITQGDEDQLTLSLAYYNPVSIAFEVRYYNLKFSHFSP